MVFSHNQTWPIRSLEFAARNVLQSTPIGWSQSYDQWQPTAVEPECSHSNCTLLCYLNGDLTMKKPKTGKTKMMTFLPWYSRFQNCLRIATCEIFTMRSSISPLENSLKIGKKILKSHIYICWFQQALFDHRVANFFGNFKLNTRAKKLSSSVLGFLKFKIA